MEAGLGGGPEMWKMVKAPTVPSLAHHPRVETCNLTRSWVEKNRLGIGWRRRGDGFVPGKETTRPKSHEFLATEGPIPCRENYWQVAEALSAAPRPFPR